MHWQPLSKNLVDKCINEGQGTGTATEKEKSGEASRTGNKD